MSTEPNKIEAATEVVAKHAPTEQQESRPGVPKRIAVGQTVCNEKNEKGKLCNGHLKEMHTAHPAAAHLRGDDALHQCQTCGALYMGPPMGHVRDPRRQKRYVEKDLAAILRAAGGTLPAYDYPTPNWKPAPFKRAATTALPQPSQPATASASNVAAAESSKATAVSPVAQTKTTTPAAPVATTQPAAPTGDETPAEKRARLAAELRAKYAGAAKPAAKKPAETDASTTTESQPQASTQATSSAPVPAASAATPTASAGTTITATTSAAPDGDETPEQKRDRIRAELKAKYAGGQATVKKATPAPPTVASAPDSSTEADRHRPAAEAQAATGQASPTPLSPAAATASPHAGAETVSDLAPEASTELTPGAPADERPHAEVEQSVAAAAPPSPALSESSAPSAPRRSSAAASGSREIPIPAHLLPPPGETMEEKVARLKAQIEAGKRAG